MIFLKFYFIYLFYKNYNNNNNEIYLVKCVCKYDIYLKLNE